VLRCMSPLLARNGHGAMSELSPLSGVKRKLDFGVVRAAFDPWLRENVLARKARRIVLSIVLSRQPSPVLLFFKLIEVETKFPSANSISAFSRSQDPQPTFGRCTIHPLIGGWNCYYGRASDVVYCNQFCSFI
jgi:hypothetical protein